MCTLDQYVERFKKHLTIAIANSLNTYRKCVKNGYSYGNCFVSRPYMIYKNKSQFGVWIRTLLDIFTDKNILLVEGKYSRSGVGNDMFKKVAFVKRILVSTKNLFAKYDNIKNEMLKNIKLDTLILLGTFCKTIGM